MIHEFNIKTWQELAEIFAFANNQISVDNIPIGTASVETIGPVVHCIIKIDLVAMEHLILK